MWRIKAYTSKSILKKALYPWQDLYLLKYVNYWFVPNYASGECEEVKKKYSIKALVQPVQLLSPSYEEQNT